MSINNVVLVGRLARDVEFKTLPSGSGVVNNALAVNHWRKDPSGQSQEYSSFIDVSFFGRTAEVVNQYLRKGALVGVTGRLEQQSWKDAATGQNRSKLVVIVENMQMLESKSSQQPQNSGYAQPRPQGNFSNPVGDINPGANFNQAPNFNQSAQPNSFGQQATYSSVDELPF